MDNTKQHDASAEAVDPRYPNTPIGIVRSRDAFLRDLPALLTNPKYDRWLALYHGDERIALAETHEGIRRQCNGRVLNEDEAYLGCVTPQCDEEEEEIESGFHEFEETDDE